MRLAFFSLLLSCSWLYAADDDQRLIAKAQAELGFSKNQNETEHEAKVLRTPFGVHIRFQATYRGLPVWNQDSARLSYDKQGVLKHKAKQPAIRAVAESVVEPLEAQHLAVQWFERKKDLKGTVSETHEGYYQRGDVVQPVTRVLIDLVDVSGMPQRYMVEYNRSENRAERTIQLHHAAEASARVYAHNPIAGTGRSPKTFDDWSQGLVDVTLKGLDDSGLLRGEYVDMTADGIDYNGYDGRDGNYTPGMAMAVDGQFIYDPSQPEFEEVMAYFYVDSAQRTLQSLGFEIYDRPIPVNAHYFVGNNAFYSYWDRGLHFGDGTVDIAEDGSVITHEYGHAILGEISGLTHLSYQTSGLHEGFSDYFSFVMARAVAPEVGADRHPQHIGEWFAAYRSENDPPHLRSLLRPSFTYPGVTGFVHTDGQLWSSAFYELDALDEPGIFFSLLLEALHNVTGSYPEHLVKSMLDADLQHFNGKFQDAIRAVMTDRGFYMDVYYETATPLVINQTVNLEPQDGVVVYQFQASDADDLIELTIDAPEGELVSAYLANQAIPSPYVLDTALTDNEHIRFELNREGSQPPLQSDRVYFLTVEARHGATIRLQNSRSPLTLDIVDLGNGGVISGDLDSDEAFYGSLVSDSTIMEFSLQADQEDRLFILDLRVGSPETNPFGSEGSVRRIIRPSDVSHFRIRMSDLNQTLYATLRPIYGGQVSGVQFRLKSLPEPSRNVVYNQALEGTLDSDGRATLNLNLRNVDQFSLTSNNQHKMHLISRNDNFVESVDYNGKPHVFLRLDGEAYETAGEELIPAIPAYDTSYSVIFMGEPGSTFNLTSSTQGLGQTNHLAEGGSVSMSIAPSSLTRHSLDVPANAESVVLTITSANASGDLHFLGFDLADYSVGLSEPYPVTLREGTHVFRQLSETQTKGYGQRGSFKPGHSYELWFYNRGTSTENYTVSLNTSTSSPETTLLGNGDLITVDAADVNYLRGLSESYVRHYRVEPGAGVQQVDLLFDVLTPDASHPQVSILTADRGWQLYSLGDLMVTESLLGFCPDEGFDVVIESNLLYFPDNTDFQARVGINAYQDSYLHLSEDTEQSLDLYYQNTVAAIIDTQNPSRRVEVGFHANEYLGDDFIGMTLLDTSPVSDFVQHEDLVSMDGARLSIDAPSSHRELLSKQYLLYSSLYGLRRNPSYIEYMGPMATTMHTRFHAFETQTDLPGVPEQVIASNLQQRLVTLINPTNQAVTVTIDGTPTSVPGYGAAQVRPEFLASLGIQADIPLVIFEELLGETWSALSAPSPYLQDGFSLPHLPPSTSPWVTILSISNNGENEGSLVEPLGSLATSVPQGQNASIGLRGTTEKASWLKIEAAAENGTPFKESALAATQYWTLDQFFASNATDTKPSETLVIPHIPNFEQWWLGLSLSNPNESTASIRVHGFDSEGNLMPETKNLELGGNETIIGVLQDFFESAGNAAWLRVESSLPIMGMSFIGSNTDGSDVASYALPSLAQERIVLPGTGSDGWYGLAIINPFGKEQQVTVDAIALDGTILKSHQTTIAAQARELIVGETVFGQLGQAHYLRASSGDGRIIGIQLSGHGGTALSLQSGIGIAP